MDTLTRAVPPPSPCPLEEVLELLAGAWTVKILWYLCQGPHHFGALRRELGGVSAKVLTARLRTLEQRGVVSRRVLDTQLREVEYAVTPLGEELRPILQAMEQVAARIVTA